MGIVIREFTLATGRTRVRVGELFEVELSCAWSPISEGGTELVALSTESPGFEVAPPRVSVDVESLGGVTTKRFSLVIGGPGGQLVNVVATAPGGSQDIIVLEVVP